MWCGAWLLTSLWVGAAPAPTAPLLSEAPANVADGDFVEVDGEVYQRQGDKLVPLAAAEDGVSVTGTSLERNDGRTTLLVESVTSEELRLRGAVTLADALSTLAGVQVSSSLGLGQEVSMDGLDGRHVLVLIDGRPVAGKVNQRVDLSRLPITPDQIARIDVVRGPVSARYGSEAMGGVINIITKRADVDEQLTAELRMARWPLRSGSVQGSAGFVGGHGPVAVRLHVDRLESSALDRGQRDNPVRSDGKDDVPLRQQQQAAADLTLLLPGSWDARLGASLQETVSHVVLSPQLGVSDRTINHEVNTSLRVTGPLLHPALHAFVDGRAQSYHHRFQKLSDGDALCGVGIFSEACGSVQTRTDAQRREGRVETGVDVDLMQLWSLPATDQAQVAVGAVWMGEQLTRINDDNEDTIPGGGARHTWSAYAEGLWQWGVLRLSPAVRFEGYVPAFNNDTAWALSPKLSAQVQLPVGFYVRGGYGQGFRLPSFEERFLRFDHSELGYIVQGNPELAPERSHGVRAELGYALARRVNVSITGAGNFVQSLITEQNAGTDTNGTPIFSYGNAARATTLTLTLHTDVRPHRWLHAQADWQWLPVAADVSACPDGTWLCTGTRLSLRAAHQATLRFDGPLPTGATWMSQWVGTSARVIDGGPAATSAPSSLVWTLGLVQPLSTWAEVSFHVHNVLDQYDATYGPKPGRQGMLSLRAWL
jgi:outer membrane receptor for ferrienterochelin and colicins